jgi:hypothetical protein
MVRLWTWILRSRALTDSEGAGLPGIVSFLLWAAPAFGLAVGGSQMAKHGVPILLAVVAPLVVWLLCLHFLVTGPESQAKAVLLAESFEPASIKAKTDLLRHALTEAAALSQGLEAQLATSNNALQRIQVKAADYKELADLNKPAADAVARAFGEESARSSRIANRWAVFYFAAGVAATVIVTVFSKWLII